jgi:hypothetical protein
MSRKLKILDQIPRQFRGTFPWHEKTRFKVGLSPIYLYFNERRRLVGGGGRCMLAMKDEGMEVEDKRSEAIEESC